MVSVYLICFVNSLVCFEITAAMDGVFNITNSNRTEWSTIQGVIGRVISNRLSA